MDNNYIEELLKPYMAEPGGLGPYTVVYPHDINNLLDVFRQLLVENLEEFDNPDEFSLTTISGVDERGSKGRSPTQSMLVFRRDNG